MEGIWSCGEKCEVCLDKLGRVSKGVENAEVCEWFGFRTGGPMLIYIHIYNSSCVEKEMKMQQVDEGLVWTVVDEWVLAGQPSKNVSNYSLSNDVAPSKKNVLCRRFFSHIFIKTTQLHSPMHRIKWIKLYNCSTSITKFSFFGYVIYSSAGLHCYQYRQATE